jgi:preprotein translocase subunit YajC
MDIPITVWYLLILSIVILILIIISYYYLLKKLMEKEKKQFYEFVKSLIVGISSGIIVFVGFQISGFFVSVGDLISNIINIILVLILIVIVFFFILIGGIFYTSFSNEK